jgi:hypothetical protein
MPRNHGVVVDFALQHLIFLTWFHDFHVEFFDKKKKKGGKVENSLKYPNNLDQSLNDAAADKIRKYRADYNNRPPTALQEFSLHRHNVACSTSSARRSRLSYKRKSGVPSPRMKFYVST